MILMNNIIDESNKNIFKESKPCRLPISFADKRLARRMHEYITNSITPDICEKYDLRPAVGLAAPQVNILKRMFAVHFDNIDGVQYSFAAFNPVIIERSEEIIYLPGGEGCLSVNRETEGLTPRNKKITATFIKWDFINPPKEVTETFEGYPAIVFQHEYDHLSGTLFVDTIALELPNAEPAFDIEEIE